MTPERCIEIAIRRALAWENVRVATELGLLTFRDLAADLPIQGYLAGQAFDVRIEVTPRGE